MPPKKKPNEPSKKTEAKKKEKIIEDKTFGLKNKKGSKNQKFIQQVQHQVQHGNQSARKIEVKAGEKKKDDKKKEADELNNIFKPVTTQKVTIGVDPKSVLCAFFKQGQCTKGDKCKFSHDLNLERKAEKKSVYCDVRDEDLMENWDEEKLKEVVEKKHGEAERKLPKTDIICRYFLDALESSKYGWFWECPNGGKTCHYRHALPSGFVLKRDAKKQDKKDDLSIEELVETQRAQLGLSLTKITLHTFMAWKQKKIEEKRCELSKEQERKKAEFKAGRHVGLSGRDMFTFRPEMAEEDAIEEGDVAYDYLPREDDEDEINGDNVRSIKDALELIEEALCSDAREADGTGTVAEKRHWQMDERLTDANCISAEASGGGPSLQLDDVPIDENLFEEDDDLDELELEDGMEELGI